MIKTDERSRKATINNFKRQSFVSGVIGGGLLSCGVLALKNDLDHEIDMRGPPYFTGGFVVGALALLQAHLCWKVAMKGHHVQPTDATKEEVLKMIQVQVYTGMFTFFSCIVGFIFIGISGHLSKVTEVEDEHERQSGMLATLILGGCILMCMATINTCRVMNMYWKLFGIDDMIQRRHTNVVHTGGLNVNGNLKMQQLQTQNIILQQQIQQMQQQQPLQQQLNNMYAHDDSYFPPPVPLYTDPTHQQTSSVPNVPPPAYVSVAKS